MRIGRCSVNSYKVFLCVGICVGSLVTAALGASSGLSPLRVGLGSTASAVAGLIGARIYYILIYFRMFLKLHSLSGLWDTSKGGVSVLGALVTFVPASSAAATWLDIPVVALWDHMGLGVLAGGFWIKLGCVFNGCCGGRETTAQLSVHLRDTVGVMKRRIPVQFLEMAWSLIGFGAFCLLWRSRFPEGSYALAVLAGYGIGRLFLEPLRERPAVVFGRVYINQIVAALLAIAAGVALIIRNLFA